MSSRMPLQFRSALTASIFYATLLAAFPSQAGLFDDNEARRAITDLQVRMAELESQLSTTQRALLDQTNQIEQLQQQIAAVRGQNEELSHQLSAVQQEGKNAYAEVDRRLKSFEPQQRTVDGIQGTVHPGEAEAFDTALQHFRNGDFKRAESLFKTFITEYANSPYQPTAQYWLGNALYAQREYKSAIAILERVVKRYPTHPRAPEALLAIAQNQLEQGQKNAAHTTLQQIVSQYSNTEAAQSARQQLTQLR